MQVILRAKEIKKGTGKRMTPVCAHVCAPFSKEQLGKATSEKRPAG